MSDSYMSLPVGAILAFNGTIAATLFWGNLRSKKSKKSTIQSRVNGAALWIKSPLKYSSWLSSCLGDDASVKLKMEAMQPSGSFKIRGISECMKQKYSSKNTIKTFVTTSSSNAGMAVAYTAQQLNLKCKVILDESQRENELIKELTETYGAEVEFEGDTWNEADDYALKMCSGSDTLQYVNMYNDPLIWNGHSSILTELEEQCDSPPDAIVCAVGGGGLLMGVFGGLYKNRWSRQTKVIAVQSENCALLEAARRNGFKPAIKHCVSPDGVDLGYRSMPLTVTQMAEKFESFNPVKSLVVKDEDVLNSATLFGLKERALIEPLCAVTVAAVLKNKEYFKQFKNIVVIVCGGNHIHFEVDKFKEAEDDGTWNLRDYDEFDEVDEEYMYSLNDMDDYDSATEEM